MKVKVYDRLDRLTMPFARAKRGDVGHDLFSVILKSNMTWLERVIFWIYPKTSFIILWPNQVRSVHSGLHLDMPQSVWCEVLARSSAARRKLHVIGGIIDSGYNGELFTVLHNMAWTPRIIREGERYSQVIFHRAIRPEIMPITEEVFLDVLAGSDRGLSGFGSTGK